MELEGLSRTIQFFKKKKFKVATLLTDRHKQIAKWARENLKSILIIAMISGILQNV